MVCGHSFTYPSPFNSLAVWWNKKNDKDIHRERQLSRHFSMGYRFVVFLVFLGSVFATSDRFVDAEIAAKFYFTALAVPIGIVALVFGYKNIDPVQMVNKATSLPVLKSLFAVGPLQAVYGLLQYAGLCQSNNASYAITGSFDNPAGFAAVLSLLFPIGLYCSVKSRGWEKRLLLFMAAIILVSVCLSGSRTGVLSLAVSAFLIGVGQFRRHPTILRYKKWVVSLISAVFVLGVFCLYLWRKDSADGRVFIWKVSWEMIRDRPFIGFGTNGFQAKYMDYQAKYLEANPLSRFGRLADNVRYPFNEFVKIAVNHGIMGLSAYLALLAFILWKILKRPSSLKVVFLSVFVVFIVLSSFSYPTTYSPVLFLLAYFSLSLFSDWFPSKKLSIIGKIAVTSLCATCFVCFFRKSSYEAEWKSAAMESLSGQTERMLPEYKKLYPNLRHNALFLYNYGAELNEAKRYAESTKILSECRSLYNDYDLEMLVADNYSRTGNVDKAIETYKYAAKMIPCRFLPLFRQFEIYKDIGDVNSAKTIARQIVNKDIKVKSGTVSAIVNEAQVYLEQRE